MHCDNKGIEPIYSIETNSYRTNKEIIHKKEDTRCIKIIKHYKKRLTMTMLQKKKGKDKNNWRSRKKANWNVKRFKTSKALTKTKISW